MAFSIAEKYLSMVAVKDIIHQRCIVNGKQTRDIKMVPLGEGYVDWDTVVRVLLKMKFDGPVSMHSEYSNLDVESVVDQTRMDIRFFRRIIAEALTEKERK
ncbi:MAG: hypothetical protein HY350_03685 [Candidatus Omnitrophica bacterium]|nr:hypothetical protein [Candidatus Omnitrophota bacterium]